jgi:hypothetical protein
MKCELKKSGVLVLALALSVVTTAAGAQTDEARRVLDRFRELRPTDDELAMYRVDWVDSLDAAKRRAAEEDRPIVVVAIHARYGDLFTGHC